MNAHVNTTIAKALSVLDLVKRFSKGFNNQQVSKALYCALVRSRLEYACAVWSPYQSTYLARLESVQKECAIFALPHRRDPTTHRLPPYNDRLNELGLLPLWCRRLVAQATVIFDLLMGRMQCGNLRSQIIPNSQRRSRSTEWLHIPYHRTDGSMTSGLMEFERLSGLQGNDKQPEKTDTQ